MSIEIKPLPGGADQWTVESDGGYMGIIQRARGSFRFMGFTAEELRFIAAFLDKQAALLAEAATPEPATEEAGRC